MPYESNTDPSCLMYPYPCLYPSATEDEARGAHCGPILRDDLVVSVKSLASSYFPPEGQHYTSLVLTIHQAHMPHSSEEMRRRFNENRV